MAKIKTIRIEDERVKYLSSKDEKLGRLIKEIGDLNYQIKDDPYKYLVETIVGQLISVKAADAILNRLLNLCGGEITLSAIDKLPVEEIKSVGISLPKARYIKGITDAVISGELDFDKLALMDTNSAMKELKKIKGIGDWTAKMYALSFLDGEDILPVSDVAFMRACKWFFGNDDITPKEVEALAEKWKPYSSIATRYLYYCLGKDIMNKEI